MNSQKESLQSDLHAGDEDIGRLWGRWIIIVLAVFRAIVSSSSALNTINNQEELDLSRYPDWYISSQYVVLALAIILILAAVGLFLWKRWGLYAGVLAFGGDALSILVIIVAASIPIGTALSGPTLFALIADALMVFLLFRYLTQEPQRHLFK